jgi:hypothetical protein
VKSSHPIFKVIYLVPLITILYGVFSKSSLQLMRLPACLAILTITLFAVFGSRGLPSKFKPHSWPIASLLMLALEFGLWSYSYEKSLAPVSPLVFFALPIILHIMSSIQNSELTEEIDGPKSKSESEVDLAASQR